MVGGPTGADATGASVGAVSTAKNTTDTATVLAWHDALNARDVDTLVAVSSDDVELSGPRGASQGLTALREWAAESGVQLVAGRMFVHDGVVVVQEQGTWPGTDDDSTATDPTAAGTATIASAYRVVDGQVVSVFRHADLDEALAATGLGAEHEVDTD